MRAVDGMTMFNAISFVTRNLMNSMCTATLVKVLAVTNSGDLSPVGFVDLQPMVNLIDGAGIAVKHFPVYKCPYFRLQGGANAIVLDPQVGDIGIAIFADRDISSATANKDVANPGSFRRFDWADALYLGGVLNGAPTQYVQFNAAGITVHSPMQVIVSAPDVQVNATTAEVNASTSATVTSPTVGVVAATAANVTTPLLTINGATLFNGPISQVPGTQGATASAIDGPLTVTHEVTGNGKHLSTHIHTGGTIAGDTGAPV